MIPAKKGASVRIFAISDIHIDYDENRRWLHGVSQQDYRNDILILAGDVSDATPLLTEAFAALKSRFKDVLFVPGNHDLWVHRNGASDSLARFHHLRQIAADYGLHTEPAHFGPVSIVPLFGWYDYSFGRPPAEVVRGWGDFSACRWPAGFDEPAITGYFVALNEPFLAVKNQTVISFSHFLPRIDLMPFLIPPHRRGLYPVLGTTRLEAQVRQLGSNIHVYGHSHINMRNYKDNTIYINNAFGYPRETRHTAKKLVCVFQT